MEIKLYIRNKQLNLQLTHFQYDYKLPILVFRIILIFQFLTEEIHTYQNRSIKIRKYPTFLEM